jgi:dihydrofolate reductase
VKALGEERVDDRTRTQTPTNRTRGERHDRYLHLRHLFHPRRLRLLHRQRQLGGYWGKQGPELLDHRLALYDAEQRMVFGANTYRQFVELLGSSTEESEVGDPWVTRMRSLPATVVSTTLEGPLDWPNATVVSGHAVDVVARLKEQSEVPLRSHGSLSLNRALMAAGLVDYVQVTLFPVITGQTGLDPIFQGTADFDLELVENRTLDGHIQELIYRPTLH